MGETPKKEEKLIKEKRVERELKRERLIKEERLKREIVEKELLVSNVNCILFI